MSTRAPRNDRRPDGPPFDSPGCAMKIEDITWCEGCLARLPQGGTPGTGLAAFDLVERGQNMIAPSTISRRRKAGFTLIELLVVVAVIGIIASIALPNLLNALNKAKQKKTVADLKTIGTAVEAYSTDMAAYPKGISSWTGLRALITPFFIKSAPD